MNISPVRFTAATTRFGNSSTNFQDIINKPQTYTIPQETPAASTSINNTSAKKKSPAKAILGTIIAAGAIAAGLAFGATKTNIFAEGSNQLLNKAKGYLSTAGNFIADKAVVAKNFIVDKALLAKDFITQKLPSKTPITR